MLSIKCWRGLRRLGKMIGLLSCIFNLLWCFLIHDPTAISESVCHKSTKTDFAKHSKSGLDSPSIFGNPTLAVSNLKKSTVFLDVLLASLTAIWIIVIPMMSYISKLLIEFKIQFYIGEQASRLLIVTSY